MVIKCSSSPSRSSGSIPSCSASNRAAAASLTASGQSVPARKCTRRLPSLRKYSSECRLVAARERRLGAALFLQPGKREFEVLAGSQFAGGIIGAGTEIAARPQATYRHAIAGLRRGIADPKFREKRFGGQIFKPESLLAAELSAQAALPIHRRQIDRSMGAGKLGFPVWLGNEVRFSARGFHRNTFGSGGDSRGTGGLGSWLAASFAPVPQEGKRLSHPIPYPDECARSRGAMRPRLAGAFSLSSGGRREDRVRAAPAVSRAIVHQECAHEHTGSAESIRPSLRSGLRLTSCSPR